MKIQRPTYVLQRPTFLFISKLLETNVLIWTQKDIKGRKTKQDMSKSKYIPSISYTVLDVENQKQTEITVNTPN